jgi:acyl-CoA thioester hydrolase
MATDATYRGTVYPWQCDHVGHNAESGEVAATCEFTGVHLDRKARKSAPFAPSIRNTAMAHLDPTEPALA